MGLRDFLKSFSGYRQYKALGDVKPEIAFYSEMGTDRIYFEGIIHQLIQDYKQKILYFTSSQTDPFLKNTPDGMTAIYIGEGTFRTLLFAAIDLPLFVMTLPDLNTFHLKRSQNKVHYAYLFHSIVSTHMIYRHQAFDAYDTVFAVGPHHEKEIREAEQLFNLPSKTIIPHGYPRIDKIIKDYQNYLQKAEVSVDLKKGGTKAHILVAPSWGPSSISSLCVEPLLKILLEADYQVTFRPHPMTLRQEPDFQKQLLNQFNQYEDFTFDDDISNPNSLFESDLMVSDWSGVALEFALGTEKPVIFIDTLAKCNNSEFERFESVPIESSLREQLGAVYSPDNLEELPDKINNLLQDKDTFKNDIMQLRETHIYNTGQSDKVGSRELFKLLQTLVF